MITICFVFHVPFKFLDTSRHGENSDLHSERPGDSDFPFKSPFSPLLMVQLGPHPFGAGKFTTFFLLVHRQFKKCSVFSVPATTPKASGLNLSQCDPFDIERAYPLAPHASQKQT